MNFLNRILEIFRNLQQRSFVTKAIHATEQGAAESQIDDGHPKAKCAFSATVPGKAAPTIDWIQVWFDIERVYMAAQPADQEPWTQDFRWDDIKHICFQVEDIYISDGIYVFTKVRPESYVIPIEAIGGQEFWAEVIHRGLFDAELAITAATSIEGQFWWPPEKVH